MEPIDYARALVRRWPIIAIGALIGAAIAFLGTDPKPAPIRRTFTATHTLLATDQSQFNANAPIGTITFAQVPVFATTGEVPRRVAQQLNWPGTPAALASQVAVKGDPSTGTITFTITKDDPAEAVTVADAFADQTVKYLAEAQDNQRQNRQQKLLGQANELEAELRDLDGKVNAEAAQLAASGQGTQDVDSVLRAQRDTVARQYSTAFEAYRNLVAESEQDLNVTTLERAQPVQVQTGGLSAPRTRSTRVPIGAVIGAVLGALVALVAERLDVRLRDRRRAEEAFGASVVAELPTLSRRQRASQPIVRPDQHSAAAEAFRSLRTSITFMAAGGQPLVDDDRVGVVLITSPSPADGKTTVAVNLAAAFAETGRSVVVVNADFRRPSAAAILAPGARPAPPAGIAGIDRLGAHAYLLPTDIPGVQLLDLSSLGGPPGDLARATVRLVSGVAQTIDVVVIDTPPLMVTTEALEFVPDAKVVVLIGRVGRTTAGAAQRAGELVRFGGAEQVAVALSDTGTSHLRRASYYDYYSGNRTPRRRRRRPENRPRTPASDSPSVDVPPAPWTSPGPDGQEDWTDADELVPREP